MLNLSDLGQTSMNDLDLGLSIVIYSFINCHVLIYLTICTNFHLTGFKSFLEIYSLSIFPYKNKRDQM